jgi:hypothetical protein
LTVWNPRLLHLRARGFAPLTRKCSLLVFSYDSRALNVPPSVIMLRRDHARFLADDAGDTPVPRHQAAICHQWMLADHQGAEAPDSGAEATTYPARNSTMPNNPS